MIDAQATCSIFYYFQDLKDARMPKKTKHKLTDIITIAISAVICGADSWIVIEEYAHSKAGWLKSFLALPSGIPSHDTFERVFSALDATKFATCFMAWVESIAAKIPGDVIAIDGKTLRGSAHAALGSNPLHIVSAWSTTNRLVLAQSKVDDKSNEITAIPRLLDMLDVNGCTVTLDAMGTQKKIAKQIIRQGGDYVLALKGKQGLLHSSVKLLYDGASKEMLTQKTDDFYETVDADHGRIETRRYWLGSDLEMLDISENWEGIKSIGIAESITEKGDKISIERRYYLTSLQKSAKQFGESVRAHWGIEAGLHWVLDVSFREDHCRIREANAAQNFATLSHIALNLLNQTKVKRLSVKTKRLKAAWDNDFALKILLGGKTANALAT